MYSLSVSALKNLLGNIQHYYPIVTFQEDEA